MKKQSVACIVFMAGLAAGACAADAPRPNLLIIHTDEHNFRTLGCYRNLLPKEQAFVWGDDVAVETPHIDSLAREGALCDRFYAASASCTPSRASFVTGFYPQNTGAIYNDIPLRDDMVTFAEALRRNGYTTGYAGKWHLDGEPKPGWGPQRRFGFTDNRYMFNRGHWKKLEDTPEGPRVKDGDTYAIQGADEKSFTTDFLADKTVDFIRAHKDRPFCFMVSIPDPHGPNAVRPPYDTMYDKFTFQLPASARGQGRMENMRLYFGMVKCIDDNVGKILAALRETGVDQHTLVVFTSDHGDMCGEHGLRNKGIPLEASVRIPFVIRYPGRIRPGTVVHEALNTVDFKPTILSLIGVAKDGRGEGRDASGLFLTNQVPADWQRVAFSRYRGWMMAVTSQHKFIVAVGASPKLYDLQADPFEMRDLFNTPEARPVIRELGRALMDYAVRCKDPLMEEATVRADLAWAAGSEEKYNAPPRGGAARKGKKRDMATGDDTE